MDEERGRVMDEDDTKRRTGRGGTNAEGDHTENKKAGDSKWGGGDTCGIEGGKTGELMEDGGWKN